MFLFYEPDPPRDHVPHDAYVNPSYHFSRISHSCQGKGDQCTVAADGMLDMMRASSALVALVLRFVALGPLGSNYKEWSLDILFGGFEHTFSELRELRMLGEPFGIN